MIKMHNKWTFRGQHNTKVSSYGRLDEMIKIHSEKDEAISHAIKFAMKKLMNINDR
jgi:hypothetical protein